MRWRAGRRHAARSTTRSASRARPRRAAARTRSSSTSTATIAADGAGHRGARAHRAGAVRGARGARGALPRRRAPGPVLLADDGARRRHRRAERRQPAQRPADPGELRAAQRSRRPQRAAGARLHLLLERAARTTSTSSAGPSGWSPGRSRRRGSTSPTRTSSAPTSTPSGWPRPASSLGSSLARRARRRRRRPDARRCATVDARRRSTTPTVERARAGRAPSGPRARSAPSSTSADWCDDELARRRRSTAPRSRFDRRLRPLARASTAPRSTSARPRHEVITRRIASRRRTRTRRKRLRARGRGPARAAHAARRSASLSSPTSTATATSPARASCPATASRGCRCRRSSPAAAARQGATSSCQRPRFLAITRVRAAQHRLPRGRPLPHQPGHPPGRADRGQPACRRRGQAVLRAAATCTRSTDGDRASTSASAAARRSTRRCTTCFRLQNVATKRRDRITSDEEERQRQGYEIRTGVRFAELRRAGRASRTATVDGGDDVAGDARPTATPRRSGGSTSAGRRRKNRDQLGFVLDTERGYWARNEQAALDDPDDPMSQRAASASIPYVEDRRNCLLLEPDRAARPRQMASLAGGAQARDPGRVPARGHRARRRAAADARRPPPAPASTRRPKAAPASCAGCSTTRTRSPRSRARRSRSATSTPTPARTCAARPARTRGLRGGLLRLPAELRQPARPPAPRPPARSATCCCSSRGATVEVVAGRDTRATSTSRAPAPRCDSELERRLARLPRRAAASRCRRTRRS